MRRREFVAQLASAALAWPVATLAQRSIPQSRLSRIGFLGVRPVPPSRDADRFYLAFREGMRELGYVEGQNLVFEWRTSGAQYDLLPQLAADLVRAQVDVIVASGSPAVKAAQQATTTVPIVMAGVTEPVALRFVASLARPGGNTTGVTNLTSDLSAKQMELLRAVLPKLSHLAILANPSNPAALTVSKNLGIAAGRAHLALTVVYASTLNEIENAYAAVAQAHASAVIVQADSSFILYRQQIAELATKNRLPSMYSVREHVVAGGLMSYGVDGTEHYRRAASYVDKILKGAKPADLPIEQPLKFEFVVNLVAAKAIGVTIPETILVRADEVIR